MTRDDWTEAVCADPGDDGVRLAYADWLEGTGSPVYAHYVRGQIEMAAIEAVEPSDECCLTSVSPGHWCAWQAWNEKYGEKLAKFRWMAEAARHDEALWRKINSPLEPTAKSYRGFVRRGFVRMLEDDLDVLRNVLPSLVGRQPIERVRVRDRRPTTFSDVPALWERDMSDVPGFEGGYYLTDSSPPGNEPSRLPGDVFDAMKGLGLGGEGGYYFVIGKHGDWRFDSVEAANEALSCTLLAMARKQ